MHIFDIRPPESEATSLVLEDLEIAYPACKELEDHMKPKIRYFCGDIRNIDDVQKAMAGVNVCIYKTPEDLFCYSDIILTDSISYCFLWNEWNGNASNGSHLWSECYR